MRMGFLSGFCFDFKPLIPDHSNEYNMVKLMKIIVHSRFGEFSFSKRMLIIAINNSFIKQINGVFIVVTAPQLLCSVKNI